MEVSFQIEGARQLQNQLHQLPGRIAGRVMRGALSNAARIVRRAIIATFRSRGYSAFTRRQVRVRALRNPGPTTVRVQIQTHPDAYYLRFSEFGVDRHVVQARRSPRRVLGYQIGNDWRIFGRRIERRQPEQAWLRPAFDANADAVVQQFAQRLDALIDRELSRLR